MAKRDCIDTFTFSKEEMQYIVDLGLKIKEMIRHGYYPQLLKNKSLGMIFDQTSTRTRCSAEVAMTELGGHALYLAPGQIQLGESGHEGLEDTGHILGQLLDIIGVRIDSHKDIECLAKNSQAPVVNFMSEKSHPSQALGDLVTIEENMPDGKKLEDIKVAFVGDTDQITLSTLFLCAQMGMHFVQFGPKSNQISPTDLELAKKIAAKTGGTIEISDEDSVLKDADFVYTDVWYGSYEAELKKEEYMKTFYPKYQVNDVLLQKTNNSNVKFLHCLPANRGEEVTKSVLEGPHSIVWDQAENKKTVMRAIFVYLLNPNMKHPTKVETEKYDSQLSELLAKQPYKDNEELGITY